MTGRQLSQRVEFWRRKLHLQGWELEVEVVSDFPDSPDSFARCHAEDNYNQATLSFKRAWLEDAEYEDIEVTVVHELLHVLMRNFDHAVERIDEQLAPAVAMLWHAQCKHERENLVDTLSRLIVALHDE